jgi:phage-related holin
MKMADIGRYIQSLWENKMSVAISAIATTLFNFLFPTSEYRLAAIAVFGVMMLDVLTKIFSLARIEGGLLKAFRKHVINSSSLAKGTMNKLIVFGVMIIICGLAYRLAFVSEIAIWFTQVVFTVMFLRDVLSIFENLTDAGIDVGLFKHIVRKKMVEYTCEEEDWTASVSTDVKKGKAKKAKSEPDDLNYWPDDWEDEDEE